MEKLPAIGAQPTGDPHAAVMALLREFWPGARDLNHDDDVFDVLRIYGDDAFELMETYSTRFGVEMSSYRWYFYREEEGWNAGALFFHPPYARVKRIPITLDVLAEGIRRKHWPLQYPDHQLPKVRWDIRLNLFAMLLLWVLVALVGLIEFQFLNRNFE